MNILIIKRGRRYGGDEYYGEDMYIPILIHTQLKKSRISHTHTQSIRGFSVKTGTGSDNTHTGGFICHLYPWVFTNKYI